MFWALKAHQASSGHGGAGLLRTPPHPWATHPCLGAPPQPCVTARLGSGEATWVASPGSQLAFAYRWCCLSGPLGHSRLGAAPNARPRGCWP